MSDNASSLFGWDLLYGSVRNDVKNNQDVLVCFVHLILVSKGFKCIGIGDSKTLDGSEAKTESLPRGWNDGYAIRYVYQGRLYQLKGTDINDGIIINLIRTDERSVSMIQLNNRMVIQRTGTLNDMIPDNVRILDMVRKQLIDKIISSTKSKDMASQTSREPPQRSPSVDPFPTRQPIYGQSSGFVPGPGPLGVGSTDLNPFGANPLGVPSLVQPPGGGGMLFVPPRGSMPFTPGGNLGIPGGSLPPGARFDPFRPPDADPRPRPRPRNPDNDEMPPPGFEDMFM